ncbi:MAG: hypothetical protein IKI58_00110 [Oscillospiraceae bacterium]|nr:hypothetical protein [Oscillospiraceae bacterium]
MLRKLEKLLAVLPVLAMAAASVTFIRSLFYNFHNDTVPLISIGISCVFALLNLAFLILSALCIFVFVRQKKPSLRRPMVAGAFFVNLGFGALCALVKQAHYGLIGIYLLATSLCFALAYLLCSREKNQSK